MRISISGRHFLLSSSLLCSLALGASKPAAAVPVTYNLTFTSGTAATATGSITLDPALLTGASTFPDTGYTSQDASPFVSAFSLTVTGALSGNGTFTLLDFAAGDFGGFLFQQTGPIDFFSELVGQAGFGDFNIFSSPGAGAPLGLVSFIAELDEGNTSESITLSSFAPSAVAVPEIDGGRAVTPFLFCCAGLMLLGSGRRRSVSI